MPLEGLDWLKDILGWIKGIRNFGANQQALIAFFGQWGDILVIMVGIIAISAFLLLWWGWRKVSENL